MKTKLFRPTSQSPVETYLVPEAMDYLASALFSLGIAVISGVAGALITVPYRADLLTSSNVIGGGVGGIGIGLYTLYKTFPRKVRVSGRDQSMFT